MSISNHPNTSFARKDFLLLDGKWKVSINGKDNQDIVLPFCPESIRSQVEYRGFIDTLTYRKTFTFPKDDERVYLCFGAVDRIAEIYVNHKKVGIHEGGYTPFSFDITDFLVEDENLLEVVVTDDPLANVPKGKQSMKLNSYGCYYTRTTGIWQSVYLEKRPKNHIRYVRITPNAKNGFANFDIGVLGKGEVDIEVSFQDKIVAHSTVCVDFKQEFKVELSEIHLWEVGKGNLYDVKISYNQDVVFTYFGLRDVEYRDRKFLLNGKPVFQRFVLDQGYYPKGVYTATPEELEEDIKFAIKLGFNGARLHQKLFPPKYLEICDRLGFMVYEEYASWGMNVADLQPLCQFLNEWREGVERDYNHPSIITWCPLNEAWYDWERDQSQYRDIRFVDIVYDFTKKLDSSRPCIDVSGGMHGHKTDVMDFHCYDKLESLKNRMEKIRKGEFDFPYMVAPNEVLCYQNEPLNLSEFGGVAYGGGETAVNDKNVKNESAWGYTQENDEEEFVANYERTVDYLLGLDFLSGYCYTQLYDIEQEQNGFESYDRVCKFSEKAIERIRLANSKIAKIEK